MVIPFRTGLATLAVASLAFAVTQTSTSSTHPIAPGLSPTAELPDDGPQAAYAGCAALAVGGLGLFARFRRR